MIFFERRKIRKDLKNTIHRAHVLVASRGDLLAADDLALLRERIAKANDLPSDLSTYWARHSFATNSSNSPGLKERSDSAP